MDFFTLCEKLFVSVQFKASPLSFKVSFVPILVKCFNTFAIDEQKLTF